MKPFKFFQKGTVDMMDGETYATASLFNADTPDGHTYRRRLYHTDHSLYERLQESNNVVDTVSRRINGGMIPYQSNDIGLSNYVPPENEPYYQRLFPQVTVTQVKPTFWTRVKIFGTGVKLVLKESWKSDPFGVMFVSALATIVTIIGIAKLLGL